MTVKNEEFDVLQDNGSIQFTFSSTMENIDHVIIGVIDYLYSKMDGIKEHAFSINLVLREGLTNAIRHGNANDPEKLVKLSLAIEDDRLIKVAIEDQGDGFDWKSQSEAEFPEDEDHGRGIFIIDSYFNRYSYNDKGNILYLEKEISS
jgi:serine/threonine-protein kinase RsbW